MVIHTYECQNNYISWYSGIILTYSHTCMDKLKDRVAFIHTLNTYILLYNQVQSFYVQASAQNISISNGGMGQYCYNI